MTLSLDASGRTQNCMKVGTGLQFGSGPLWCARGQGPGHGRCQGLHLHGYSGNKMTYRPRFRGPFSLETRVFFFFFCENLTYPVAFHQVLYSPGRSQKRYAQWHTSTQSGFRITLRMAVIRIVLTASTVLLRCARSWCLSYMRLLLSWRFPPLRGRLKD